MKTLADYQQHLTELLSAGRGDEFVTAALPYLQQVPSDEHIRLMTARELIRLGLFAPARELLRSLDPAATGQTNLASVLAQLPQQCGKSAFESRRQRFEANLKSLQERHFDIAGIREQWNVHRSQFELFADSRGVDQVRFTTPDNQQEWCGGIADHRSAAEAAPPPPDHKELMPSPYLFDGVGMGWFFHRIWRTTRNTFLNYSPAIYVTVADPGHLAVALHLHDWTELLSDPRVMIFLGGDADQQLRSFLVEDTDLPLPAYSFAQELMPRAEVTGLGDAIHAVAAARSDQVRDGFARIESKYAGRDAAFLAQRFEQGLSGEGPPLRILASVSTHTTFLKYSMRDAARAARQLGCEFEIITEARPFERIGVRRYHEAIERFNPDLFFAIDHLRSSFVHAVPSNLPVMTWDQDHLQHVFTESHVRAMQPIDVVVGLPHLECVARFGRRREQFIPAHMATCPEEFDASSLAEEEVATYRCDVSYVSHGSETAETFHESELAAFTDPNARRLIGALLAPARAAVLANEPISGLTLRNILATAEKQTGIVVADKAMRDRLIGWHLWRLCDRVFRHQALEWVGQWAQSTGRTFKIYGRGWELHPTLAKFAAGVVENGRELLKVYRGSAINLQLMPAGFLHQRALDGLMAGAFFMTRRTQADTRDPRLPRLVSEIRSRDFRSAAELLAAGDSSLTSLFNEVRLAFGYSEHEPEETFCFALNDACLDYPGETLPHFGELVFNDADSFAKKAGQFLADTNSRQRIADEMRQVAVERYSYRSTMRRFLHHAMDYFRQLAVSPLTSSMNLVHPSITDILAHRTGKQIGAASR